MREALASLATRGLTALGQGLAHGGVVGHRAEGYEVADRTVAHHDLLVIESMRARPMAVSMSAKSVGHSEDSRGLITGVGTIVSRRGSIAARRRSMVAYRSISGPPTSNTRPAASGGSKTSTRYRTTSSSAIGWARVATHLGVTMMRRCSTS